MHVTHYYHNSTFPVGEQYCSEYRHCFAIESRTVIADLRKGHRRKLMVPRSRGPNKFTMKDFMNSVAIEVKRTDAILKPDPSRVLLRPFSPGDLARSRRVVNGIMAIPQSDLGPLLAAVEAQFSPRHAKISDIFGKRFEQVRQLLSLDGEIAGQRRLLIGSYFLSEFSVESAALFNPSMVANPNQGGLPAGALRFVMSFRATGDGGLSSIVFRTGIIHGDRGIEVMPATGDIVEPNQISHGSLNKTDFERKLLELGLTNEFTQRTIEMLGASFTLEDLLSTVVTELKKTTTLEGEKTRQETARRISMLAECNYSVQFLPEQGLSERVIFPVAHSQRKGIEDARFVRFERDDGNYVYYATFTSFDGEFGIPQLLETSDFLLFQMTTLNGPGAKNKGMALFPRKINGSYAMLSRPDSESIHLMFSDNVHFWKESRILLQPASPWELIQIGNCGSPIETKAGWLVLSHGVGAVREYCIGAFLLDLENPAKVIGRLAEPLLKPIPNEWAGNVPNVAYSCGAIVHDGVLFIPDGVSDYATRFATVQLDEVLAALEPNNVRVE